MHMCCTEIYYAFITAEKAAAPVKKVRIGSVLYSWSNNTALVNACNKAKFWYRLWSDCDRPRSGIVNDILKHVRKEFDRELALHRIKIQDYYSSRGTNPAMLWKNVVRTEPEFSFSASHIPESEWSAHLTNEFVPSDPEAKAEHELTKFLNMHPVNNFLVTRESVITAITRLKRKRSLVLSTM